MYGSEALSTVKAFAKNLIDLFEVETIDSPSFFVYVPIVLTKLGNDLPMKGVFSQIAFLGVWILHTCAQ
jgi:hypothetical protein